MPRYNEDKIATLISEMKKSFERLNSFRSIKRDDFLGNLDKIDSAKYNFIVAIESAIDICNHIISKNNYRMPKNFGDTFKVLHEQGAFSNIKGMSDKDFIKNLISMAKFRNRLVHIYWEINEELLYDYLQNNLVDLKIFLDKISQFLNLKDKI